MRDVPWLGATDLQSPVGDAGSFLISADAAIASDGMASRR